MSVYHGNLTNYLYQVNPKRQNYEEVEWWYFGLTRDKNGKCVLEEIPFNCPDGRDKRWDAETTLSIPDIKIHGSSTFLAAVDNTNCCRSRQ